jgi:hypothetical protein
MTIPDEKLKTIGFSKELDLSDTNDPLAINRKLVTRILAASNAIAFLGRQGYANYVQVDTKYLSDTNKKSVGDLRVIESEGDNVIVGSDKFEEKIEFKIKNPE